MRKGARDKSALKIYKKTNVTSDPVFVHRHTIALPNTTESKLIKHNLAVPSLRLRPQQSERQLGTACLFVQLRVCQIARLSLRLLLDGLDQKSRGRQAR